MALHAPFRLLIAGAAALFIAAAIASSTAHALLLGDAILRSSPGAPLRVVIPLKATPGEALDAACFRLVPARGDGALAVTARVSLERAAATPRLIVTTQDAIADPVARFGIEAGCDGAIRRNYALLLDRRGASTGAITVIPAKNSTREPGQERLGTAAIAAARTADKAPTEPARAEAPIRKPAVAAGAGNRVVDSSALGQGVVDPRREPGRGPAAEANDAEALAWYIGAPVGMGALALGVLFITRRRAAPELPDWTRGGEYTGPRSHTDMSAQPVTLSHGELTPMPRLATRGADGASLRVREPSVAANTLRSKPAVDVSTLDTLMNEVSETDRLEVHAVREAWTAARGAIEREEDNAILRAIDAAEREMLYVSPPPAEATMDRALKEDLTPPRRRPDKAAA